MSKILQLACEVVINQDTGKARVMVQFYRDDVIDFKAVLHAGEAEKLGYDLIKLANDCRQSKPQGGGFVHSFLRGRKFWQKKNQEKNSTVS